MQNRNFHGAENMHNTVSDMDYKLSVDCTTQTAQQTDVLHKDNELLTNDRCEVIKSSNNNKKFCKLFIIMIENS